MGIKICEKTIQRLEANIAPLYVKPRGQMQPNRADLCLNEKGDVWVMVSDHNTIPMDVWHRRTLRWKLLPQAYVPDLARFLKTDATLHRLLERVHEGHHVTWDGSNHVGTLTDAAQDAYDDLYDYLGCGGPIEDVPYEVVDVWNPYDFFGHTNLIIETLDYKSIESYVDTARFYAPDRVVFDQDAYEAVADMMAKEIERYLERGTVYKDVEHAAYLLKEYDSGKYSSLYDAVKQAVEAE